MDHRNPLSSAAATAPELSSLVDCVACGSRMQPIEHLVRETRLRTGESFLYGECKSCGSLGINDVPEDLAKYYDPLTYYSFGGSSERWNRPYFRNPISRRIARYNTAVYLRTGHGLGLPYARLAGLRPNDRILDIGCGDGARLFVLHVLGYRHLCGIDPFLDQDRELVPGVPLLRLSHSDAQGAYDWVMMHHSLEHTPDPHEVLASVRRLLSPTGRALIRMPFMGSHAWRKYGTNWVQIDAPRHLHLYTLAGFRRLAENSGFTIERVFFDSTHFQFWASELVARNESYKRVPEEHFDAAQLGDWADLSETLNLSADGDQVGYVIRAD